MGLFNFISKPKALDQYQDEYLSYQIEKIGNLKVPESLTDLNAFLLANSVAEMFFPVDFYADRISKLRFFIGNKSGKEVANTELNRLIEEINPLYKFSDLIYQYVFSMLADGNAITYRQKPSIYDAFEVSANNISRVDVLRPDQITLYESNINPLLISNLSELIKRADVSTGLGSFTIKETKLLQIDNYSLLKRSNSNILSKSPLFGANKSIDTLLSVYSARYNVYANNGAAGYLAKKQNTSHSGIEAATLDADNKRDEILKDINNRNGITGKRNLWGISGVPIEFVKTLATISELMPLEETLESSIKIAGIYQIPPVLVPRKDQSTYDNQANAEKNVWENSILSLLNTVLENWTNILGMKKSAYKLCADTSNVSALLNNESEVEDLKAKKLANLQLMKQLNPELDITTKVNDIYNE